MSKKTGYQPKARNSYQRNRKSIVLLATEGKNKTETQYFKSIPSLKYVIRFAPGNYTDPVNMMRALKREFEELELETEFGDAAFCLVDSDVDPAKDSQLEKADGETADGIKLMVSSPCFEIWYLCHFSASTRQYGSNDEVLRTLKQHIPEYKKEMAGIREIIWNKTDTAINNAKMLEQQCFEKGIKLHSVAFTPSTEVYKIVELLIAGNE